MSVRCKFVCCLKDKSSGRVMFSPVYGGSPENEAFFSATPAGHIEFFTVNPKALEAFNVGSEYYIDISLVS